MFRKSQARSPLRSRLMAGLALASLAGMHAALANDQPPQAPAASPGIVLPSPPDVEAATLRDLARAFAVDATAPAESQEPRRAAVAEVEIRLDLPPAPAVILALESAEAARQVDPVIVQTPVVVAPPDLPAVVVSIEIPVAADAKAAAGFKPLDAAVMRTHLEAERARLKLRPAIVDGILAAYAAEGGKPGWMSADGILSPTASVLRDMLALADQDGLDATRLLSVLPTTLSDRVNEADRERLDTSLSLAAYLYAHDARGGRLEPSRLSSLLTPSLSLPVAAELLPRVWQASPGDLADLLARYQPAHPGYRALKKRLMALRAELAEPATTSAIDSGADAPARSLPKNFMDGGLLLPGQNDPRVPALRIRLSSPTQEDSRYDPALVEAVKAFQRANGLTANGRITPRTREALENLAAPLTVAARKADPREMLANLQVNMERWRWLPPELGKTHIFVNVPEYRLDVMSERQSIFNTRVIVGKPDTQTPIFSDAMDFLVVNPSWHVPPSILKNEFIPRLAVDPQYAAKRGYEVVRRGNSISVRQPPGDRNALGHVKFMFPNQHAVYLHDTPSRHLFASATRAFSHGCVRVEGPFRLAEQLLLAKQGFTEKALRAMVGHGERTIRLNEKIPVHLTYFTLGIDESGALVQRADIYGHDARIRKALSL